MTSSMHVRKPPRTTWRWALWAAFLCLQMLPSCVTKALWSGPERGAGTALSEESKHLTVGTVAVRDERIVWRAADGHVRVATPTGPRANQALMLLANRDYADVWGVKLEFLEAFVDGELVGETLGLALHFRSTIGQVAYVVSRDALTPEALAGLAAGTIGDARVPPVHRELLNRLPFLDLGAAIGRTGAYSLASQVFLNADGSPAFTQPLPANSESEEPSMSQRLELLRDVSLLLRLEGPEGTLLVRAYADRLWLGSRLGVLGLEQAELRTSLKFDESEHVETMVLDACPVPAEYVHRVQHYSRVAARSNEMSVWAKLALTPFTIALDVVGGVLIAWLGFGDGDDDDDPVRARVRDNGNLNDGMSRARPRRSGEDEAKWRARENGRR
ncbi:MAG: hypothetical protein ACI9SE_004766 [Neolewinella sp.]|jgi:hypothetical protein